MKMTGIWRLDSTKYRQRNAAGLLLKPALRVVGSFLIFVRCNKTYSSGCYIGYLAMLKLRWDIQQCLASAELKVYVAVPKLLGKKMNGNRNSLKLKKGQSEPGKQKSASWDKCNHSSSITRAVGTCCKWEIHNFDKSGFTLFVLFLWWFGPFRWFHINKLAEDMKYGQFHWICLFHLFFSPIVKLSSWGSNLADVAKLRRGFCSSQDALHLLESKVGEICDKTNFFGSCSVQGSLDTALGQCDTG